MKHVVRATDEQLSAAVQSELTRDAPTRTIRRKRANDDSPNYHSARVLLLVDAASPRRKQLKGLTKLAKLDFLLRYPVMLERLLERDKRGEVLPEELRPSEDERSAVESRMIRYKYGPWDERYYQVLASLVGRGLIEIDRSVPNLAVRPTPAGRLMAQVLRRDPVWALTGDRATFIAKTYSRYTGNRLKETIYSNLPEAVDLPQRSEIP